MKYEHRFKVRAPHDEVVRFHRQSSSMGAITPPPVIAQVHQAPDVLQEGDEMDFTLWLGPLPIHWLARIEQTTPNSFVDRQIRGPFAKWEHRHTFQRLDDNTTEVVDQVEAVTSDKWLPKLIGMGMWINMPVLFAFRGWKTRRLLENNG